MNDSLGKEYLDHPVFEALSEYANFYNDLSYSMMHWVSQGTNAAINIDTYVFSSIFGTLQSIQDILTKGRVNDAYALLRKYYDTTIINIYTNLYLTDHFSVDNFVVEKVNNWLKGKEKIESFEKMPKYIINSPQALEITKLIYKNSSFKGSSFEGIRERCNEHTHYFFFHDLLLNDNELYLENRIAVLESFSSDLRDIFIMHLSYLFYLNEHYMMSGDYLDCLECGITPEEGSQYFVAPFIQKAFNKSIKKFRPDIAFTIKNKTEMQLE